MNRNKALGLCKLFFSVGLLVLVVYTISPGELVSELSSVSLIWFFSYVGLVFLFNFIGIYRWKLLTELGGIDVSFWRLAKLFYIAQFFRQFSLGLILSDLYRAHGLSRSGASKPAAVGNVVLERVVSLMVSLILLLLPLPFIELALSFELVELEKYAYHVVVTLLFLTLLCVSIVFFARRFKKLVLEQLKLCMEVLRDQRALVLRIVLVSAVFQICTLAAVELAFWSIGVYPHRPTLLFVNLLVFSLLMFPISINGVGLREWLFLVFGGMLGIAQAQAVAAGVVVGIAGLVLSLFGGGVLLFDSFSRESHKQKLGWIMRREDRKHD